MEDGLMRRYWSECRCGDFTSAESLDRFMPEAEAAEHMLPFRLGPARLEHQTFVRWRVPVGVG